MASSDNLPSLDPWLLRSAFTSEPFLSDDHHSSLYNILSAVASPIPAPNTHFSSGSRSGSGSDPETVASKRAGPGPASGRVGKRKPRASKKNPTTYITADAANFREMVQQVTGVRFPAAAQIPVAAAAHVLKPEPQRITGAGFGGRIQGRLPTLDTSSALLLAPGTGNGCDGGGMAGLGFDDVACFPTLDSWKAL